MREGRQRNRTWNPCCDEMRRGEELFERSDFTEKSEEGKWHPFGSVITREGNE